MRVADVRTAVALTLSADFADGIAAPREHQNEQLRRVLDEVLRWSRALQTVRGQ